MASVVAPRSHVSQAGPVSLNTKLLSRGPMGSRSQVQDSGISGRGRSRSYGHSHGTGAATRSCDDATDSVPSRSATPSGIPCLAKGPVVLESLQRKHSSYRPADPRQVDDKQLLCNKDIKNRGEAGTTGVTRARGASSPTLRTSGIFPGDRDAKIPGSTQMGLPLAVMQKHMPPSPVSPNPEQNSAQDARIASDASGAAPGPQRPTPQERGPQDKRVPPASASGSSSSNTTTQPALSRSSLPLPSSTINTAVPDPDPDPVAAHLRPNRNTTDITLHPAPSCNRSRASTFQLPIAHPKGRPAPANERPVSFPSSSSAQRRQPESATFAPSATAAATTNTSTGPCLQSLPEGASGAVVTTTAVTAATCAAPSTATKTFPADSAASSESQESLPPEETSPQEQKSRQQLQHHPRHHNNHDADNEPTATVASHSETPVTTNPAAAPPHRLSSDEKRSSRRPPVSFKPPLIPNPGSASPASGRAVIPPIRAFRSSGSRRSLVLDMNPRNSRSYDHGDDSTDSNHRDKTLRALEGRDSDEPTLHHSRASIRDRGPHGDDGGDMFLRIAREEFARKSSEEAREGSTVSRVTRASHSRRPYSAAIASYQPTSPPRISRRLSDQQETKRSRAYDDDRTLDAMARAPSYRETMDRLVTASEHSRSRGSAKSNPATPRALTFQDGVSDTPPTLYNRRRGSASDSNGITSRPPYKNSSLSYSKTYNSSPLVPRQEAGDLSHGFEGTESTASTNAPSAMWDEVDKMKCQIERIQKKGTRPANSAVSRGSDERPPTATTTVTTMSTSPKRTSGSAAQAAEASSTASPYPHKDPHPILQAALSRAKPAVSTDVYRALEMAVNDAVALAGMMGSVGQPGPISSGASSIGHGTSVTDRQLRRKADTICRSLTELCIALSDEGSRKSPPVIQTTDAGDDGDVIKSPTATGFLSTPPTRRLSAVEPQQASSSPRNASRLEERRANMMISGAAPSPRFLSSLQPDSAPAGRKSSLLVSRTRRAGTEEVEEGRRSSLLRTRRAGTEEPEDGRKSSLFVRSRRNTIGDEEEGSRLRAPSRSNTTELAALRALNRERESASTQTAVADPAPSASALPRRRLAPSALAATSRLAAPASTPSTGRRYLDRTTPDRDTIIITDRPGEERSQRQYVRPSGLLGRSGSLSRRNRDSMLPSVSTSSPASHGYR